MEMARLWKAVELLSSEIEVTRRRVNALEHNLIPNIKETIRYISNRLEEIERSYQVQLMRVKEIIRGH
jgi:V/A-type H+-transporting ATPase subunit D